MGKSKELATLTDATTLDIAGDLSVGGLTVGTDQLAVDASGRVTMPYQPAFHAYNGGGSVGAGNIIVHTDTFSNVGNCYNTSTGVFTAPIAGTYTFYSFFLRITTTARTDVFIRINGSISDGARSRSNASTTGYYETATCQLTATLAANDTIDTYVQYGTSYSTDRWGGFGGYLIG